MANITIANNDNGSVLTKNGEFRDETLTFAGTDVFAAGTILARRAIANAVTASAVTGTGNGTVTLATVAAGPAVPIVGAYVLTCTAAVTNGGVWSLTDPNGSLVATGLTMTAGAGAATAFEVAGLLFTITDGSTDFAAGDTATLTVAADGTLVPFDPAGDGGEQAPLTVLTYEVSRTGAGTVPVRVPVSGLLNATRLIIDADGDGSNITAAILDQLRSAGLPATDVQQLGGIDNPQS